MTHKRNDSLGCSQLKLLFLEFNVPMSACIKVTQEENSCIEEKPLFQISPVKLDKKKYNNVILVFNFSILNEFSFFSLIFNLLSKLEFSSFNF